MSQATPKGYVDTESGTQLVSRLNSDGAAMLSKHGGTARPSYAEAGTVWQRTNYPTATLQLENEYDGADDIARGHLDLSGNRWYPTLPKGGIAGLTLANNGTDAANDIDIAAGYARSADDAEDMVLLATLTKRLDAAWAVGSGNGGIDTGAEATSTLYAVWLIKRPDTGVVDALFSTSFSAPTMPTNYTRKRLIGAIFNDAAGAILAFKQVGDYFRYTGALAASVSDATITNDTFEVGTLNAPPDCLAHLYGALENTTETGTVGRLLIRRNGAGGSAANEQAFAVIATAGTFDRVTGNGLVMTDASRQIQYAAGEAGGTATVTITVLGFHMLTRSNP